MLSKNTQNGGSCLSKIDFLGSNFNLGFSTKSGKFQTTLGGYITILMILVTLGTLVVVLSDYFNKDSPVVTTSTEFGSSTSSFNLYEENLYVPLGIVLGPHYIRQDMSKYATIKLQVDRLTYNEQAKKYDSVKEKTYDFVPCSQVSDTNMQAYVEEITYLPGLGQVLLCPDFRGEANDFTVSENSNENTSRMASMKIYPCSLADSTQCATAAELADMSIEYASINKLLTPSNFKEPVKSLLKREQIKVDVNAAKLIKHSVKRTRIVDDTSDFINPKVRIEFAKLESGAADFELRNPTQLHCTQAQISQGISGGCREFLNFEYVASGEVLVVRRNYKKFTVILGEFGGILKLITTFVFFFYSFYNRWKVKDYLGSRLFSEEAKKKILGIKDPNGGSKEAAKTTKFIRVKNKLEHESAKEQEKENAKEMDEAVKEYVRSRSQIVNLMNKLNSLELIEKVVFDENDKKLLPLVLIKARQNKLLEKMNQERLKMEKGASQNPTVKNFAKQQGEKPKGEEMSYKEAYKMLVDSNPSSKLKKTIRDYMLDVLAGVFEEDGVGMVEHMENEGTPLSKFVRRRNNIQLQYVQESEVPIDSPKSSKMMESSQRDIISSRRMSLRSRSSQFGKGKGSSRMVRKASKFGNNTPVRIKMKLKKRNEKSKFNDQEDSFRQDSEMSVRNPDVERSVLDSQPVKRGSIKLGGDEVSQVSDVVQVVEGGGDEGNEVNEVEE